MAGRFGKYGDVKRKSQIRRTRHAQPLDRGKLGKRKPSRGLRRTKRRAV